MRIFPYILFLLAFSLSTFVLGFYFHLLFAEFSLLLSLAILFTPLVLFVVGSRRLHLLNSEVGEVEEAMQRYSRGFLSRPLPLTRKPYFPRLIQSLESLRQRSEKDLTYLRQNHRQSDATIRSMNEGLLVFNSERRIINLNPAAARLLHMDEEILQGKNVRILGELGNFLYQAEGGEESREFLIQRPPAAERWLRVKVMRLKDDRREDLGALVELSDISEQKRFERTRQDFVANVSHELKTPITSIQGYVETLLDGSSHSDADRESFLQIISRQATRLSSIVGELLTLARLETEQSIDPSTLSDVSIKELLSSVQEACSPVAESRGVIIHTICEGSLQARMNRWLIEQALINLLDNAIKYGTPNSVVRVVAHVESRNLMLSVVDEGPGISSDHLPRLFERFYRIDKARSRKAGGSGLGLSIVKHIAAVHGGRVLVESEIGKGSTFAMMIPLIGAANVSPRLTTSPSSISISKEPSITEETIANSNRFGRQVLTREDTLQNETIFPK